MEARRAHNPEVVGSSPASATIKTPDFDKKSGVFSNFSCAFLDPQIVLGFILGFTPKKSVFWKSQNPNFFEDFPSTLRVGIELTQIICLTVAGQGILSQIVGANREEVHQFGKFLGHKYRGRSLDHNAQLSILAAQADDQHTARIGMANHALENVLCIQEVISHLGAAGIMGEGKDAVTSAGETLLSSLLNQANGGVHAGNRGNNPQLVSGSHPAICSAVAQEGISSSGNPGRPLVALGLVAVGQLAGQE